MCNNATNAQCTINWHVSLYDVRSLTDTDGYPSKIAKTVIMGILLT